MAKTARRGYKWKRTQQQREMDYKLENEMHLKGYRNWEIAQHISAIRPYTLSNTQVGIDLAVVRERWKAHTTLKIDEHKQRELERLDVLERENWEQFRNSEGISRDGKPIAGNPLFLQAIERIVELRAKLLGLEAPKQAQISGTLEVQQSAKLLVLAKVEAMAARVSLYPSEGEDDNIVPLTLPESVSVTTVSKSVKDEEL